MNVPIVSNVSVKENANIVTITMMIFDESANSPAKSNWNAVLEMSESW